MGEARAGDVKFCIGHRTRASKISNLLDELLDCCLRGLGLDRSEGDEESLSAGLDEKAAGKICESFLLAQALAQTRREFSPEYCVQDVQTRPIGIGSLGHHMSRHEERLGGTRPVDEIYGEAFSKSDERHIERWNGSGQPSPEE